MSLNSPTTIGMGMAGVLAGTLCTGAPMLYADIRRMDDDKAFWDAHFAEDGERIEKILDGSLAHNLYTPCTPDQNAEIAETRRWVMNNYVLILDSLNRWCEQDSNFQDSRFYKCELSRDQVFDAGDKMLSGMVEMQVFCPTIDQNMGVGGMAFGYALRSADEDRGGQIAIFPLAFDEGGCRVVSTYLHELGHVTTGEGHDINRKRLDWVDVLGDVAKRAWELEHGDCK